MAGSSRQKIQENDLVDDCWIRKETIDVLQHVGRHHVAQGVQLPEVPRQVTWRLVEMTDKRGLGTGVRVQPRGTNNRLYMLASCSRKERE